MTYHNDTPVWLDVLIMIALAGLICIALVLS